MKDLALVLLVLEVNSAVGQQIICVILKSETMQLRHLLPSVRLETVCDVVCHTYCSVQTKHVVGLVTILTFHIKKKTLEATNPRAEHCMLRLLVSLTTTHILKRKISAGCYVSPSPPKKI